MSKNLFGFVTFGNLEFTKLAVKSIRDTVKENEYEMFSIVGKPGDVETHQWLLSQNIPHIIHGENMGFPCGVNDIYDYAWKTFNFDNVILLGNDVVLYPHAADSLINLANTSDYEVISALQYDVRDLIKEHPETARYFSGGNFNFTDFSSRPWDVFVSESDSEVRIGDMQLYDIQNLCLYKRGAFEKVGYTDVNFYPAYFIDNDYARRIILSGIKCCTVLSARFFHFWSRTVHQGSGGSTNFYFESNKKYYRRKWGGDFGREKKHPDILINSRDLEQQIIKHWRNLGK